MTSHDTDLEIIKSNGNQVIRRLDRVHNLLESMSMPGADQADIETIEAAQSLLEGAQEDTQQMQQLAIDVKKGLGGDD